MTIVIFFLEKYNYKYVFYLLLFSFQIKNLY